MEYTKNSNDQKALDEKKKAIQEEIDNYKDLQKNVKNVDKISLNKWIR